MKEILTTEFASVYFDETSNSIIIVWKKPTTSESYRAIFKFILLKIEQYCAEAIISDIYYQGLVGIEDRAWLQEEIIPKAYKSGIRKVGIIAPSDVFSRFYIESVKAGAMTITMNVEFCYFQDLISAQAWVMHKKVAV
jgi:hypothetical protein